ncbi:MAG: hypothetical protein NVSMB65_13890 [Chloroflexota bacterium]
MTESAAGTPDNGASEVLAEQQRVLIAAADAVLCFGLRLLLQAEGYSVSCVGADPAAVVARTNSFTPHLILVDVAEPGGWEQDVLGRLRADPQHLLTGIVILAAATDPRQITRQALASGADDVIFKPCDRDLLVTRLISALRAKHLLRQKDQHLQRCLDELQAARAAADYYRTLVERRDGPTPLSSVHPPASPAPAPDRRDEPAT